MNTKIQHRLECWISLMHSQAPHIVRILSTPCNKYNQGPSILFYQQSHGYFIADIITDFSYHYVALNQYSIIETITSLQYRSVPRITSIIDRRYNHKSPISFGLAVRQYSIIETITSLKYRSVSRITSIIDHRNNQKLPISSGVSHYINNWSSIQLQVSNIVRCLAVRQYSMTDTIKSLQYRSVSRITSIIDHRNNHKPLISFGVLHYINNRSSKQS